MSHYAPYSSAPPAPPYTYPSAPDYTHPPPPGEAHPPPAGGGYGHPSQAPPPSYDYGGYQQDPSMAYQQYSAPAPTYDPSSAYSAPPPPAAYGAPPTYDYAAYQQPPSYDAAAYGGGSYGSSTYATQDSYYGGSTGYGAAGSSYAADPYADQRYPGSDSHGGDGYRSGYGSGGGGGGGGGGYSDSSLASIYADQTYRPPPARARQPPADERAKPGPKGEERFKVTLLPSDHAEPESVLIQVTLEGVGVFDASGTVELRSFPLDAVAKWALPDPTVLTFWHRPPGSDAPETTVRVMASDRTNRALLDTLTCCTLQRCEMAGIPFDAEPTPQGETINNLNLHACDDAEEAKVDEADRDIEFWVNPEKEGWLMSQGEVIKTWRRRWFVLKQGRLFRFKEHRLTSKSTPRGTVKLTDVQQVRPVDGARVQKHTFELVMKSGPPQLFVADTQAERAAWVEELTAKLGGGAGAGGAAAGQGQDLMSTLQRDLERLQVNRGR